MRFSLPSNKRLTAPPSFRLLPSTVSLSELCSVWLRRVGRIIGSWDEPPNICLIWRWRNSSCRLNFEFYSPYVIEKSNKSWHAHMFISGAFKSVVEREQPLNVCFAIFYPRILQEHLQFPYNVSKSCFEAIVWMNLFSFTVAFILIPPSAISFLARSLSKSDFLTGQPHNSILGIGLEPACNWG